MKHEKKEEKRRNKKAEATKIPGDDLKNLKKRIKNVGKAKNVPK